MRIWFLCLAMGLLGTVEVMAILDCPLVLIEQSYPETCSPTPNQRSVAIYNWAKESVRVVAAVGRDESVWLSMNFLPRQREELIQNMSATRLQLFVAPIVDGRARDALGCFDFDFAAGDWESRAGGGLKPIPWHFHVEAVGSTTTRVDRASVMDIQGIGQDALDAYDAWQELIAEHPELEIRRKRGIGPGLWIEPQADYDRINDENAAKVKASMAEIDRTYSEMTNEQNQQEVEKNKRVADYAPDKVAVA